MGGRYGFGAQLNAGWGVGQTSTYVTDGAVRPNHQLMQTHECSRWHRTPPNRLNVSSDRARSTARR